MQRSKEAPRRGDRLPIDRRADVAGDAITSIPAPRRGKNDRCTDSAARVAARWAASAVRPTGKRVTPPIRALQDRIGGADAAREIFRHPIQGGSTG
jgi:hypothetical protein